MYMFSFVNVVEHIQLCIMHESKMFSVRVLFTLNFVVLNTAKSYSCNASRFINFVTKLELHLAIRHLLVDILGDSTLALRDDSLV